MRWSARPPGALSAAARCDSASTAKGTPSRTTPFCRCRETDAFEAKLKPQGLHYDRERFMAHFDVQMIGAIMLHWGRIAEMKTGEGKTQVAVPALYLNALEGKGAHLLTHNDYLAKRDRDWMAPIYESLGLTVGVIQHDMDGPTRRHEAYRCDITYATNHEVGFDYLRDNTVDYAEWLVLRDLHFAIVDEADSLLIDEARTPLILAGAGRQADRAVPQGRSHYPAADPGYRLHRRREEQDRLPHRGRRAQSRATSRRLEYLRS